jgi:hypothetical protein
MEGEWLALGRGREDLEEDGREQEEACQAQEPVC